MVQGQCPLVYQCLVLRLYCQQRSSNLDNKMPIITRSKTRGGQPSLRVTSPKVGDTHLRRLIDFQGNAPDTVGSIIPGLSFYPALI